MVTAETVGRQLRDLRQMRGLSQKELSEIAGIAPAQISQIEGGHYSPSLKAIVSLLAALDARLQIELNDGISLTRGSALSS